MLKRLVEVSTREDISPQYRGTPIELLFAYHNMGEAHESYSAAKLLIGMCMDNRKTLRIPDNFAYIIRTGGGNLRYSEFKVSYTIAIGNIDCIALIGHNNCGMVNLAARKEQFVSGLVENAGWARGAAEEHFFHYAPMFEIGNEIDFVIGETKRLRLRYPKVQVAPLFYDLENNLLYLINED